jgi:predicted Fe-S protein YdhL (DUF1289 family)
MDEIVEIVPVRMIASPCVNVCKINAASGWCIGCRRTLDEIAGWTRGSEAWRDAVMAALPARIIQVE